MNEMQLDGVTYVARDAVGQYSCKGCAFLTNGCEMGSAATCTSLGREDGRSIIWVKVEPATKPCRSPYCECDEGKCTHPGYHDARGELPQPPAPTALKLKSLYVIGSLRNPTIPEVAAKLREQGHDVFDDWYSAGPEADDWWKRYEEGRGHDYYQALAGHAANHVFGFDRHHLDRCDAAVLVLPAGRSGHLELGYVAGKGKPTYILHDNPDRWDVMYRFATAVVPDVDSLIKELAK